MFELKNPKTETLYRSIVFVSLVISSLLFFLTSFNSFYWMDDFWKRYEIINQGLFSFQKEIYFNWDGRAVSPLYTFRNILLYLFDWRQAWVITTIGVFSLFLTSYFLLRIFSENKWNKLNFYEKIIFISILSIVLVLVFRPHLSRSLYWGTGVYYMFANCLLFGTIWCFIKKPNSLLTYFLLFASATSGPNNGMFLLVFLILFQNLEKSVFLDLHFSMSVILIILALSIISFAPGNFSRGGENIEISFHNVFLGGFKILKEYLLMSKWAIFGSCILAVFFPKDLLKSDFKKFLIITFASLATIIPFLVIPDAASKHTAIFFQTGLLFSCLLFFDIIIKKINIPISLKFLLGFSFSIYSTVVFFDQIKLGSDINNKITERYLFFEAMSGNRFLIELDRIEIQEKNWVSRFWELEADTSATINRYQQKYFNTGPITLKIKND